MDLKDLKISALGRQLNDKTNLNKSKNLFSGTWRIGGIDLSTSLDKSDPTWTNTSAIPVTPNTQYVLSINEVINASTVYVFYYDSNLNPITSPRYAQLAYGFFPKVIIIPDDSRIAYIKVLLTTLLDTTKTQFELNTMATSYRDSSQKEIAINDFPNELGRYAGKRVFFLGDSITALSDNTGWTQYFMASVKPSSYVNYAVGGATWCDSSAGLTYDGNPATTGLNFVGNQVQRIISDNLSEPNCIFIAAGTNDLSWNIPTDADVEAAFYDGSMNIIPLTSVDRSTWAGAIRWSVEKLKILYPRAKILLCTPPHRKYVSGTSNSTYGSILAKNTIIKKMALRMGVEVVDFLECGGYNMTSIDFVDNLHPKPLMAQKMAAYAERKYKSILSV